MSLQHLYEGYDPTNDDCISTSMILQMIRNARPFDNEGWIHWSETPPDVVTNPEFANFLWGLLVAGVRTNAISFYNGSSWELIPLTVLPGTLTLDRFSLTGASARDIIQVNSLGNALIWTSIPNAVVDNTLPVSKLVSPGAGLTILISQAGVKSFATEAAFVAALTNNILPVSKLVRAGADVQGLYLRTKIDGTDIEWAGIDVANIKALGSLAQQSIRRNPTNTGWEYFTPQVSDPFLIYEERQTAGTNGGTFTAGAARVRAINTKVVDTDNIGLLSGNSMRLPAGTYRYTFFATFSHTGNTRHFLWDDTAGAIVANSFGRSVTGGDVLVNHSDDGQGQFAIGVQSDIQLQGWCDSTEADTGFGKAANINSLPEVYSRIALTKVA